MIFSMPALAAEQKSLTFRELPIEQQQLVVSYNSIEYKEQILAGIMMCESKGNPKAYNPNDAKITGYASYGLYQFQPYTWAKNAEKYKVLENATKLTVKQLLKYLYNPAYNAAVAHGMIKDGLWNWTHWRNCGEFIGLDEIPKLVYRFQ